jgi:hypothetical protein
MEHKPTSAIAHECPSCKKKALNMGDSMVQEKTFDKYYKWDLVICEECLTNIRLHEPDVPVMVFPKDRGVELKQFIPTDFPHGEWISHGEKPWVYIPHNGQKLCIEIANVGGTIVGLAYDLL